MNNKLHTHILIFSALASVLSSCSSDPRTGGIFWSESGAQRRLASMQEELSEKEAQLTSYRVEIKQLKSSQKQQKAKIATLSSQIPATVLAQLPPQSKESLAHITGVQTPILPNKVNLSSQQQVAFDSLVNELEAFEKNEQKLKNKEADLNKLLIAFNDQEKEYQSLTR